MGHSDLGTVVLDPLRGQKPMVCMRVTSLQGASFYNHSFGTARGTRRSLTWEIPFEEDDHSAYENTPVLERTARESMKAHPF